MHPPNPKALLVIASVLIAAGWLAFGSRRPAPPAPTASSSPHASGYSAPDVFAETPETSEDEGGGSMNMAVEASGSPRAADEGDDETAGSISPRRKDGRYLPGYGPPAWLPGYTETADLRMPAGASVNRGKALFALDCAPCHGVNGAGEGFTFRRTGVPLRNLARPDEYKYGSDEADIYRAVAYGFPRTSMYGFRRSLKPLDMWGIVAYVMSLRTP